MTEYLVTGHDGAVEWARRHGISATRIAHLDPNILKAGDVVVGTLPANLVVELGHRRVRYFHLVLDMDQDNRRRNLSADEMEALGARLEEVRAYGVPNPASPRPNPKGPTVAAPTTDSPSAQDVSCAAKLLGATGRVGLNTITCFDSKMKAAANALHDWFARHRRPAAKGESLRVIEAVLVAWALFALGSVVSGLPGAVACLATGPLDWASAPFNECAASQDGRLLALAFQAVLAIAFYFVGRWALSVTNEVAESRADLVEAQEAHARVLITGLSPLKDEVAAKSHGIAKDNAGRLDLFVDTVRNIAARCAESSEPVPETISWQQNARAIAHHLKRLEVIYVLPSSKSRLQFESFCDFCTTLFGRALDIRLVQDEAGKEFALPGMNTDETLGYEDYAYVHAGLTAALAQAKRDRPDLLEREVCIEATAGLKTFSIAAGILTLNRDVRFGYVTSHLDGQLQGGEVRIYDARITFAGHLTDAVSGG